MIARALPLVPRAFVLEVNGRSGRTTAEMLNRLDDGSRVFSLVSDPAEVSIAKTRMKPQWKKRVYFKPGDFDEILGMEDETYDVVVANLVLSTEVPDWKAGLAELMRVAKPGGQVLVTMALRDSWAEVEELFEEVLRQEGMREQVGVLRRVQKIRPRPQLIRRVLGELGLSEDDFVIEHQRFELLFPSGREFLFSPVVEFGPLPLWKAIIGNAKDPKKTFWRFMNAIDTYYRGHVLGVSVRAGLIRLRKPASGAHAVPGPSEVFWSDYPSLHALWGGKPAPHASSPAMAVFSDDDDFDLDIDLEEEDAPAPDPDPDPDPEPMPEPEVRAEPEPEPEPEPAAPEPIPVSRTTPPPPPPSTRSSSGLRMSQPPVSEEEEILEADSGPIDLDAALAAARESAGFDDDDEDLGDPDLIAAAIGDLLGEQDDDAFDEIEDLDDADFEELQPDDDDAP